MRLTTLKTSSATQSKKVKHKHYIIMKLKILSLLMLILPLVSCAQNRLLGSMPTGDGISKVYVGSAMLSMAEGMMGDYGDQFKDTMKDIKSVEAYSCESKKMYDTVAAAFEKLLKMLKTEEMVYSEEDGEVSQIYMVIPEGSKEPTAMLIYNADRDFYEINIVVIHGKINASTLPGATD